MPDKAACANLVHVAVHDANCIKAFDRSSHVLILQLRGLSLAKHLFHIDRHVKLVALRQQILVDGSWFVPLSTSGCFSDTILREHIAKRITGHSRHSTLLVKRRV